jgi:hypothetical protein
MYEVEDVVNYLWFVNSVHDCELSCAPGQMVLNDETPFKILSDAQNEAVRRERTRGGLDLLGNAISNIAPGVKQDAVNCTEGQCLLF